MPEFDPSILPIVARLDEAEAIADIATDAITSEIVGIVGSGEMIPLAVGDIECGLLFLGDSLIERAMAQMIARICRALSGSVERASDAVGNLLARASDNLNDVLDSIRGLVDGMTQTIVDSLNSVIDTVTETLDRSLRSIIETAETVVQSIASFVATIIERIGTEVRNILSGIGFAVSELIRIVTTSFDALLAASGRLVARIDSTVREVGEFLTELAAATLDAMSRSVAAVLGPLVGAGQSVLARLGDLVEAVPGAVRDAAGALKEGIGEFVGEPLSKIGSLFVGQVEEFFGTMVAAGNLSFGAILRPFFECFDIPSIEIDKIVCAADDSAPETPGFFVAALALVVPLLLFPVAGAALEPVSAQIRQSISRFVKQSLIAPTDLIDGFHKGDVSDDFLRDDFAQWGFSEERIDLLLASSLAAPDLSVQVQAWLRGLIEESELDGALAANRMRPADIALLKQVVFFIPPAQDLIRMAVREVFSPDVRERFGQDEDFPEAFAEFAAQQGISDEWARNYWAAHWALPSPAQGFEMLHRGVIEIEDLNVLLRALDVMPFWRDKLTQIAFSPLTRVDLRRMHGLGLLTDEDLQTRYQAIGFSADDAGLMVAFTAAFNVSEEELPDELDGLTRSTVLGFFEDGLITRDDATTLLAGTGVGEDAAELFVEQRELNIGRGDRKDLIEAIVRLAGGGRISLPDAEDQLAQLGITAIEITRAIGRILSNRDKRERLPTLANLLKMRSADIIDDDQYLDALKASGFDDDWAARMFLLNTGEEIA